MLPAGRRACSGKMDPRGKSEETQHEKGSRHLFKCSSVGLQAATMIPGLFPASGYKSVPGKLPAKNIYQRVLSTQNQDISKRKTVSGI